MRRTVVIQREGTKTEVAVLENGRLAEYLAETDGEQRTGAIYKGRIIDVLPGLDACFVDIGLSKPAYLQKEDLLAVQQAEHRGEPLDITCLVKRGETLLVQVKKEGRDAKGPKVTANIKLVGHYLIYLPYGGQLKFSRRITDSNQLRRLSAWGEGWLKEKEGLILRTAAQEIDTDTLAEEGERLRQTWVNVKHTASQREAPCLIAEQEGLLEQVVSHLVSRGPTECLINDQRLYARLEKKLQPLKHVTLSLCSAEKSLFEACGISEEINTLFQRKVWLKSGGYLVIEETEALTVIDVNTGRCTGQDHWEQTALLVNLEAAQELARQIRLRDIGGMIVIDFLHLKGEEGRQQVLKALEEALEADRKETHVLGYTALGLVEMTRKKTTESLWHKWTRPCSVCHGRGRIKKESGKNNTQGNRQPY
ncbi:Rne/Rng family ribonuclease [Caldalkalibacillus thermarum TA2.A1]|uniref:Rne/Rng family ribonuclease n=1 Tax=Caldalkalibacillus thermarum (strain TA2.A1) TaxID=986075 RepID=A0A8X8LAH4_CALTT|nr:Rne/Rng family ribonuclease [Caldalkalibacillus thermarum]QZT33504.1 Rne/Rng family ribonuclease [Caldalkalibacillus thermarum TA2.A1]